MKGSAKQKTNCVRANAISEFLNHRIFLAHLRLFVQEFEVVQRILDVIGISQIFGIDLGAKSLDGSVGPVVLASKL